MKEVIIKPTWSTLGSAHSFFLEDALPMPIGAIVQGPEHEDEGRRQTFMKEPRTSAWQGFSEADLALQ